MPICNGDWVARDGWSTPYEVVEVKYDGKGVVVVDPEDDSRHLYAADRLDVVPLCGKCGGLRFRPQETD